MNNIEAKELFDEFVSEYGNMKLNDKESIQRTLKAAKEMGIYEAAKHVREMNFGKEISVYGVSYISNACWSKCKYCPMGQDCIRKDSLRAELDNSSISAERKAEVRAELEQLEKRVKTLSVDEARQDFEALVKMGHKEICILSGDGLCLDYRKLVPYVRAAMETVGVREVILNVAQFTEKSFWGFMFELQYEWTMPEDVQLQYRVFQETFDKEVYAQMMSESDPVHGKGNYEARYMSQVNVLKATEELKTYGLRGADKVGTGVLIGLSESPIKEIEALANQAQLIKVETGKTVARCCIPFANEPAESCVEIPFMVPGTKYAKAIIELIYALARLAMPDVSIVMSERDDPEMLKVLEQYADHTTLNVHPCPGGNIDALAEINGEALRYTDETAQAEVFARNIKETISRWQNENRIISDFDIEALP